MSMFPKIRAAAGYIAGTGPGELARARATILLARLGACDDILPGADDVPVALHGLLGDLVLAVRELAGPAWLDANGDDPDVAAFTVLKAAASPPDPARIDKICSRVLWARFAPGAGRDEPGQPVRSAGARTGARRPPTPGPGTSEDGPGPGAATGPPQRARARPGGSGPQA